MVLKGRCLDGSEDVAGEMEHVEHRKERGNDEDELDERKKRVRCSRL